MVPFSTSPYYDKEWSVLQLFWEADGRVAITVQVSGQLPAYRHTKSCLLLSCPRKMVTENCGLKRNPRKKIKRQQKIRETRWRVHETGMKIGKKWVIMSADSVPCPGARNFVLVTKPPESGDNCYRLSRWPINGGENYLMARNFGFVVWYEIRDNWFMIRNHEIKK